MKPAQLLLPVAVVALAGAAMILNPAWLDWVRGQAGIALLPGETMARKPATLPWLAAAPGRVEPRGGATRVGASASGRIVEIAVGLRDAVDAGDLLVRIDDEELIARLRGIEDLILARKRERDDAGSGSKAVRDIRKAEDEVADAETTLWRARDDLDTAVRGERKRATEPLAAAARAALGGAETALEGKRKALAALRALEEAPLPTREESALAAARADRSVARAQFERTRVRSPVAGGVLDLPLKLGEVVAPTPEAAVAVIGDLAALDVKAEVLEDDVRAVRPGTPVKVASDAFPGVEYPGKVVAMAPTLSMPKLGGRGPRARTDIDVLEVTIALEGTPPLLPGMRVDVFFLGPKAGGGASVSRTP